MFRKIIISGTAPDAVNTNSNIREYIFNGLIEFYTAAAVTHATYDDFFTAIRQLDSLDLCILVGSIYPPDILLNPMIVEAKRKGAIVVLWLHDDPYEFDSVSRLGFGIDLLVTNDMASSYHYPPQQPVLHLPLGAPRPCLEVRPAGPPLGEFFFAGYPYANRVDFFRRFAVTATKLGLTGNVIGPHWSDHTLKYTSTGRINQFELWRRYAESSSTIYLGRSLNLSNARFGIRPSTPGPRLFEAAACAALQVAFTEGLEILEYFDMGAEFLFAGDADEAAELVARAVRYPAEFEGVRAAARARVARQHLYVHRVADLHRTLTR